MPRRFLSCDSWWWGQCHTLCRRQSPDHGKWTQSSDLHSPSALGPVCLFFLLVYDFDHYYVVEAAVSGNFSRLNRFRFSTMRVCSSFIVLWSWCARYILTVIPMDSRPSDHRLSMIPLVIWEWTFIYGSCVWRIAEVCLKTSTISPSISYQYYCNVPSYICWRRRR